MVKRIAIFGATSAIAQETARIWAARGDRLFLIGRDPGKLNAVLADLRVIGGATAIDGMAADLDLLAEHPHLIASAKAFLGEMDIVLIAHGVLGDQEREQSSWPETAAHIHTNLVSPISLLHHLAAYFEARGTGSIAAISSVAGDRGRASNYHYGAAKAGLSAFLQGYRNRLHGSGVHVLTIKPGFVKTPMTAHLKQGLLFATPQRIAKGIVAAIERRKDVVYLPFWWRFVMLAVKALPEFVFKRLKL